MICDSPPGSHAGYCRKGAYGSEESFGALAEDLSAWEAAQSCESETANRLFYFAIPPNVFLENAAAIKVNPQPRERNCVGSSVLAVQAVAMSTAGWNRVIIEKPFGHDLESATELVENVSCPLLSCRCCYPHSKAAAAVEIASARGHTAFRVTHGSTVV